MCHCVDCFSHKKSTEAHKKITGQLVSCKFKNVGITANKKAYSAYLGVWVTQPQNRRLHLTLGPAEVHEGWQGEVDVADEQNGLIKAVRDIGWAVPAAAQAKR